MDGKTFDRAAALRFGWETAKSKFLFFLGLIVVILVGVGFFHLMHERLPSPILRFVASLCSNVWSMLASIGATYIALRICDGKDVSIGDMLVEPSVLWTYIVATILSTAFICLGMIMLIIPGFIFYLKLLFYSYFIVDKSDGITASLQSSWRLTAGIKWDLLMFTGYLAMINLLGLLCLGVGLLVTVPLSWLATAHVYRQLSPRTDSPAAA